MATLIPSALAVCATWILMALILVGIGSLVVVPLQRKTPLETKEHLSVDALWMGLALTVALLEIWNLLLPINRWTTTALFALGLLGLVAHRTKLLDSFRANRVNLRAAPWFTLLLIATVFLLAIRACGPCDYSDTGLYGWPAVRWAETYSAVPGLANLHGRLSFNSAVFLCVAALDEGPWRARAHHLFTGFMLAALALAVLPGFARAIRSPSVQASDWFRAILAVPLAFWITRIRIVGTQTDEPAAIACLMGTIILFDVLSTKESRHQTPARLVVSATLFALAIAFKESTIVFAVLAWFLALICIWRNELSAPPRRAHLIWTIALSAAIAIPWCLRSVILSGYPFYPATLFGFPVDWKTPLDQARWYAATIQSYGRNPDAYFLSETQGFAWLPVWFRRAVHDRASFQAPLAIAFAGLLLAFTPRRRNAPLDAHRPWLWLSLPSLAGIAFWFWAAPDLRFAQFAIWTAAATLATWGILSATASNLVNRGAVLLALVALTAWCLAGFGWTPPYRALLETQPLAVVPIPKLSLQTTESGLAVYIPAEDPRWREHLCWNAPLPCTPYFDERLRLRNPPSMARGFATSPQSNDLRKLTLAPLR